MIVSLMYSIILWEDCRPVKNICLISSRNLLSRSLWNRAWPKRRKEAKTNKMISKTLVICLIWNMILKLDMKSWQVHGYRRRCMKFSSSWILCVKDAMNQHSSFWVDKLMIKRTSRIKRRLHLLIWSMKFRKPSLISLTQQVITYSLTLEHSSWFLWWWILWLSSYMDHVLEIRYF